MGIPTVTVVSNRFLGLARNEARAFGVPDLPMVIVPHPIGGTAPDTVRLKAEAAVPEIIERLTRP